MAKQVQNFDKRKIKKTFTNREDQKKAFWDVYYSFQKNLKDGLDNDIKVITYYGIGGTGKTALLSQLQRELDDIKSTYYASYDMELNCSKRAVLEGLKRTLEYKYKFKFPMFDLAMMIFKLYSGEINELKKIKGILDKNLYASIIAKAIKGFVPVVGEMVVEIGEIIDSVISEARTNYRNRELEIQYMEENDLQKILRKLQYNFAHDLTNNLKNNNEPLVIFIDTYESLANILQDVGEACAKDMWVHNDNDGLVTHIPNVIWVIGGREKLKWSGWGESLEQHLISNLSYKDASFYLSEAGINEEKLHEEIYSISDGLPFYLEIFVENYYAILKKNQTPTIDRIGESGIALIERFLKYMDESKKDVLYLMSCLSDWTPDSLFDIVQNILPHVSRTAIENIHELSFISTPDEHIYKLNKTIRNELFIKCPKWIKKKVSEIESGNMTITQKHMHSTDLKYFKNLKRLLKVHIDIENSIENLFEYYGKNILPFLQKAALNCQYYEIIDVLDVLVFNLLNEDDSKFKAKVYIFYSTMLYEEDKLKKAKRYALKGYNMLLLLRIKMSAEEIDFLGLILGIELERAKDFYRQRKFEEDRYGKIAKILERAVEIYTQTYGELDQATIRLMTILGKYYFKESKSMESKEIIEKVLLISKDVFGGKSHEVIEIIILLLEIYSHNEEWEQALLLFDDTWENNGGSEIGEEGRLLLKAMFDVILSLIGMDEEVISMELMEKIWQRSKNAYGELDIETLEYMFILVDSYSDENEFDKTLTMLEKTLELSKKAFGSTSKITYDLINRLSLNYSRVGNKEKGIQMLESALAVKAKSPNKGIEDVRDILSSLSLIYRKTSEYEKALKALDEIWNLSFQHPKVNYWTLLAMFEIAICYVQQRKKEIAINLIKKIWRYYIDSSTYGGIDFISSIYFVAENNCTEEEYETIMDIIDEHTEFTKHKSFDTLEKE